MKHLESAGYKTWSMEWNRGCILECLSGSWPRLPCTDPGGPQSEECCWCSGLVRGRVSGLRSRRIAEGCWSHWICCQQTARSLKGTSERCLWLFVILVALGFRSISMCKGLHTNYKQMTNILWPRPTDVLVRVLTSVLLLYNVSSLYIKLQS